MIAMQMTGRLHTPHTGSRATWVALAWRQTMERDAALSGRKIAIFQCFFCTRCEFLLLLLLRCTSLEQTFLMSHVHVRVVWKMDRTSRRAWVAPPVVPGDGAPADSPADVTAFGAAAGTGPTPGTVAGATVAGAGAAVAPVDASHGRIGAGASAGSGAGAGAGPGASAGAGAGAGAGFSTSNPSHVFIVLTDVTQLSCDARASSYAYSVHSLHTSKWLDYPQELRTADK
jgi:hypothetical protein